MTFWDSSALIPLFVRQPATRRVAALPIADAAVWWQSRSECVSAFSRLRREEVLSARDSRAAEAALLRFASRTVEVQATEQVRLQAERLLRVHVLRTADAYQLAAALTLASNRPGSISFCCLDERLRTAAALEGFQIAPELQ